jgi:hypothetical protein
MDRSSSGCFLDRGTSAAVRAVEDQWPRTSLELSMRTNFRQGRTPRCFDSTPLLKLKERELVVRGKNKVSAEKGGEAKSSAAPKNQKSVELASCSHHDLTISRDELNGCYFLCQYEPRSFVIFCSWFFSLPEFGSCRK